MLNESTGRSLTVRLVLGHKLRQLREAAGIEPRQLAKMKLGSVSTTSRMETGKVPIVPHKVVALCRFYGVDQATMDELETLAFRSSEDTILDDYGDVIPRWFSIYVQLEAAADRISAWQPDVMPGLLQTPATARAIFEAFRPELDERTIERCLIIRSERQHAVFGRPETRIRVVLGEGVLLRQVGGAEVAAAQREHLRSLCATDQVQVRVLTWSSGAHAAMLGSLSLLEFDHSTLVDVAYCESAAGAKYLDRASDVLRYRTMFKSVFEQSIPLEEYAP